MENEKYPEWYVDVKNICPNWITDNFLDFMDLKLENLKGKNITSIGWWFGIFEMDAVQNGAKVIVVDPMFMDENHVSLKLQENISWIEDKIKRQKKGILKWIKSDVERILSESNDEDEKLGCKKKLKWYDELQAEKNEYSDRHRQLLNHLKKWEENQKKYWLILNPSSWDNIKWIEENSQDMVIIAHTLWHIYNKSFWDIIDFLNEALKLLKSEWKLYIIDYVWYIVELERMLEKTGRKKYYRVDRWSFVCCFDRKWLAEFLDKELK